jgi:pilus assembly protein Flp/PilA
MKLNRDDSGATMVEYGLMAALVAIVCILSVSTLGKHVSTMFSTVANTI